MKRQNYMYALVIAIVLFIIYKAMSAKTEKDQLVKDILTSTKNENYQLLRALLTGDTQAARLSATSQSFGGPNPNNPDYKGIQDWANKLGQKRR